MCFHSLSALSFGWSHKKGKSVEWRVCVIEITKSLTIKTKPMNTRPETRKTSEEPKKWKTQSEGEEPKAKQEANHHQPYPHQPYHNHTANTHWRSEALRKKQTKGIPVEWHLCVYLWYLCVCLSDSCFVKVRHFRWVTLGLFGWKWSKVNFSWRASTFPQ